MTRWALVIVSCFLFAGIAHATGEDTALLPLEAPSNVPPQHLEKIVESMANRAGAARMVTPEERARITIGPCGENPVCWAEVGQLLGAKRVLVSALTVNGPSSYSLSAMLVDVKSDKILMQGKRTVPWGALSNMPGRMVGDILWQAPRAGREASTPTKRVDVVSGASAVPPGVGGVGPDEETTTVVRWSPSRTQPRALVGVRIGATIPQAFNGLSSSFLVEVEGAYQLPFWQRRLGLFVDVGYTEPSREVRRADPRIIGAGGAQLVDYQLKIQQLMFAAGVQLRWAFGRWVTPYLGVAARLNLTSITLDQHIGRVDLGRHTESSTRFGFLGRLGLGLHLGPGDVVVELQVDYTPVDDRLTGASNTGNLAFQLGYLLRI